MFEQIIYACYISCPIKFLNSSYIYEFFTVALTTIAFVLQAVQYEKNRMLGHEECNNKAPTSITPEITITAQAM